MFQNTFFFLHRVSTHCTQLRIIIYTRKQLKHKKLRQAANVVHALTSVTLLLTQCTPVVSTVKPACPNSADRSVSV